MAWFGRLLSWLEPWLAYLLGLMGEGSLLGLSVAALAGVALGESAIAVGGTGISAEQMSELERLSGPLYILPDVDPEGDEASRRWTRSLYPKAFLCPAEYGGPDRKDVADLFADEGQGATEMLTDLKATAVDALYMELAEAPEGSDKLGAYRAVKERILPLLLKLEDEGEQDAALHDVAEQTQALDQAAA